MRMPGLKLLQAVSLLAGLAGCDAQLVGANRDARSDTGSGDRGVAVESGIDLGSGSEVRLDAPRTIGDGPAVDAPSPMLDAPRTDAPKPKTDTLKGDTAPKADTSKPDQKITTQDGGGGAALLQGYWVWKEKVDNGTVVLTITDADMVHKVGSSGWPGCPDGILCTHYGIRKLAFGTTGKSYYIMNVMTSSDYQYPGTYSVAGDLVTYNRLGMYSCAHPDQFDSNQSTHYFRYKMVGTDELWVSVTGLDAWDVPWPTTPPTSPTKWIVYKRITKTQFYDPSLYMIRICQAKPGYPCNAGCFSTTLVD